MKLILHIFKKDVRRLWLEILISMGLITVMVCLASSQWMATELVTSSPMRPRNMFPAMLVGAFVVLVPLNWWWLISPVIQGERLVGDRQYWLTRPYTWIELIAAKFLFLIAFVYVPIFIAQLMILQQAGFQALHYVPSVLYNLLFLSVVLVLPLTAIATATRNLGEMVLGVLAIIASAISLSLFSLVIPSTKIAKGQFLYGGLILLLCGWVGVILLQYAKRRTGLARLAIVGILVVVGLLSIGVFDQKLMTRAYANAGAGYAALQFQFPRDSESSLTAFVPRTTGEVGIRLPIDIGGLPQNALLLPDDVRVAIDTQNGSHWVSLWQPLYSDKILPGSRRLQVSFSLPREVYERYKSMPLSLHIILAVTEARAKRMVRVSLGMRDFSVPGFGICTPNPGERPNEIGSIACRAAMREPELTNIRTIWSYDSCTGSASDLDPEDVGWAWAGSEDRNLSGFGIAPIWAAQVLFDRNAPHRRVTGTPHFCVGAPMTFVPYDVVGHAQVSFEVQDLKLPDLPHGLANVIDHP